MVSISEKFCGSKNLKFSTDPYPNKSKKKCVVFSRKAHDKQHLSPVRLGGLPLPWVGQVKHLGNILQADNSMKVDLSMKRGQFIGKVNSLLQEFHSVDPVVSVKILNIYTTSFYGSGLWDLQSAGCERLLKAWNVAIRHALSLPVTAHRYLIESLSGCLHPKTMLASRLVKFNATLLSSRKTSVQFLARLCDNDFRTVMGKNMGSIRADLLGEAVTAGSVKKNLKYFPVPDDESWRVQAIKELLAVRAGQATLSQFEYEDISDMINILSTT